MTDIFDKAVKFTENAIDRICSLDWKLVMVIGVLIIIIMVVRRCS